MDKPRYYLGIDAGLNTGYALWDSQERKFVEMGTSNFWELIKEMDTHRHNTQFVIEDPNLNKPIFMERHANSSGREVLKIAQNVGSNKREASLIIEYCKREKLNHVVVQPTTSKWTADYFKKLSKWQGRTSQHARDAAKLVIGL